MPRSPLPLCPVAGQLASCDLSLMASEGQLTTGNSLGAREVRTPGSPACCGGGATGFPSPGPPEPGALYPSGRSCWVTEIVRGPGRRRALSRGGRGGGPRLVGGGGGTPGLPQLSAAGGQCQPPWPICQVGTERAPPWMNQDRRVLAPGASSPLLSPPPRRSPFLSKALLPLEGEKRKKEEKKTLVLAYPDPSPCL